jgi:hypothetical protein
VIYVQDDAKSVQKAIDIARSGDNSAGLLLSSINNVISAIRKFEKSATIVKACLPEKLSKIVSPLVDSLVKSSTALLEKARSTALTPDDATCKLFMNAVGQVSEITSEVSFENFINFF